MSEFINAAPMVRDQGTDDRSTRVVPAGSTSKPQHLPVIYLFAEKGPLGRNYVDLGKTDLASLYGDDSFNVNKKYFTHQTPFAMALAAAGNNFVVHRVIDQAAKDVANIAMYLDVLPAQVPLYVKNSDGSVLLNSQGEPTIVLDGSGDPITVAGYKVAWVVDHTVATVGTYQRGLLTQRAGLQTEGAVQSVQYPIFEFAAKYAGEGGLKLAQKLWPALATDLTPFPSAILNEGKMYPYNFGMVKITDARTGKTEAVRNLFGGISSGFVLKGQGVDPTSGAVIDLQKVAKDQYIDLPADQASGLGTAYVYQDNLDTVLGLLYAAEKQVSDPHRDSVINNSESNIHALNVLGFTSSNGSPYQAIRVVDLTGSTRLTRNTHLFLRGASDGDVSETLLDSLVAADMQNYTDTLHPYFDLVTNPESIVYDSGFALSTKLALAKIIARRKDTFVVLSTYAHNAPAMTLEQQYSAGVALKTVLELYPESSTFGTGVMRGIVIGGSGELINSLYTKRVPSTYELLNMAAAYMGAADGKWKSGYAFDKAPLNIFTKLKNLDVTWVPPSTRNVLWSSGINFALNYEVDRPFFPALQTVYENDTSTLNSFFTAVAISYLNKVAHEAWREFTGSVRLSAGQLEEAVNEYVAARVKDRFDNMLRVTPNAKVTEMDARRGYSWTLGMRVYSEVSRTAMTTFVESYRMSDYQAQ